MKLNEPLNRAEESNWQEDLALARAVQRRDRKATAEFVDANADAIHRHVRFRLVHRPDAVEDIVQDVFLAALANLSAFKGSSSLRTWLLGIARHKVEDYYRSRFRSLESIEEQDDDPSASTISASQPQPHEFIDRERLDEKVQAVMSALPEYYAMALLWRYWDERSTREIASLIGKTEKAVERLLARARERFRREWKT